MKLRLQVMELKVSSHAINHGREGDSIFVVTLLSHFAVTLLLFHNQCVKCQSVTGDSFYFYFILM